MNYILTEEQLDNIVKPFLDRYFDNSEIMTSYYSGDNWFGIFSDGDLLIGHPVNEDGIWFYNGHILAHGSEMFSLEFGEWGRAIKRYLNKRYPQLNIKHVS